jgi:hypothetical protein
MKLALLLILATLSYAADKPRTVWFHAAIVVGKVNQGISDTQHEAWGELDLTKELQRYAPSIFATRPWHETSDKYRFISTIDVVEGLRREGFLPVHAVQSKTRIAGKGEFTRHQIRFRDFRNGNAPVIRTLGTLYPEAVVTNAHDTASAYILEGGLWRLACLNGMVAPDAVLASLRVRHTGNVGDVISITHEIVEQFPRVLDSVEKFQQLRLEAPEQRASTAPRPRRLPTPRLTARPAACGRARFRASRRTRSSTRLCGLWRRRCTSFAANARGAGITGPALSTLMLLSAS